MLFTCIPETALPGMLTQLCEYIRAEGWQIRGGDIGFGLMHVANPGDDGADGGMCQRKTERCLRHGQASIGDVHFDLLDTFYGAFQTISREIIPAEIAFRKYALRGVFSGQDTFVKDNP